MASLYVEFIEILFNIEKKKENLIIWQLPPKWDQDTMLFSITHLMLFFFFQTYI